MTLFKLIHLHTDENSECDSDSEDGGSIKSRSGWQNLSNRIKGIFKSKAKAKQEMTNIVGVSVNGNVKGHTEGDLDAPVKKMRTLQRFHSGRNEEGMVYMEKHSVLTAGQEAVSAEQVSIFLTEGNVPFYIAKPQH